MKRRLVRCRTAWLFTLHRQSVDRNPNNYTQFLSLTGLRLDPHKPARVLVTIENLAVSPPVSLPGSIRLRSYLKRVLFPYSLLLRHCFGTSFSILVQ